MRDIRRKLTLGLLAVGATLGGLALPTTASADSASAVQITLCNDSDVQIDYWIKGYNQFNDWDDSPVWKANAHTCATGWNYWWKKNSSIELHYKRGSAAWTWKEAYIPKTSSSTTTLRLS
ncbi:hypothetical protein [Streptomyces sp. SID13726]|uniref:hypothetical protein n=1 Tax=Streptomyces sp. SID13726 TaxID=2706058 RepID=UPI0013BB0241|nr:hypothetical protein [Streptomyces sp. SID13726]NEB03449.1 hypothetical protein [Streptomyces sp. SID13726]